MFSFFFFFLIKIKSKDRFGITAILTTTVQNRGEESNVKKFTQADLQNLNSRVNKHLITITYH